MLVDREERSVARGLCGRCAKEREPGGEGNAAAPVSDPAAIGAEAGLENVAGAEAVELDRRAPSRVEVPGSWMSSELVRPTATAQA